MRLRLRRVLFFCHLWIGLLLGLYFVLMGLTGSVLAFRHPIDAALDSHLLKVTPGPTRVSLDELVASARAAHPQSPPTRLEFFDDPSRSVAVMVAGTPIRNVLIDPYTGRALGERDPDASFVGWVYALHRNLLLKNPGHTWNAYAALVVTWLLISGLWLWWPKTRGQLRVRLKVAKGTSLKRRMHDLHNVFGIYSLPLLLVVVLTGVTFEFKKPVGEAVYRLTGSPKDPKPAKPKGKGPSLPLQTLLVSAEAAAPGRTSFVFLPSKRSPTFRIIRELPGGESLRRRANVAVDPATGEVLRVEGVTPSTGKLVTEAFAPIHFGHWGGIVSRLLQVLLGLVPLGLFVTGVFKTVARKRSARKGARRFFLGRAARDTHGQAAHATIESAHD